MRKLSFLAVSLQILQALRCHERTNCINDVIAEAEEWAGAAQISDEKQLLAGIPISVKDHLTMKVYMAPIIW